MKFCNCEGGAGGTREYCECYRWEGGADTEVSGKRYTPPPRARNKFQCYVTKLRLYFYLYFGWKVFKY